MRFFILSFVVSLVLVGCASVKTVTDSGGGSVDALWAKQKERAQLLEKAQGKLDVRYSVGGRSIKGSGRFVTAPGKIRLEVRDPMGALRYFLVGQKGDLLAYYDSEKTAYQSSGGGVSYFSRFFNLEMDYESVRDLWWGIIPGTWKKSGLEKKDSKGFVEMAFDAPFGPVRALFDLNKGLPVGLHWKRGKGQVKVTYSDWDPCCAYQGKELLLAHRVLIELPKPGETIEWDWDRVDVLEDAPNPYAFEISLPKGAGKVQLK